MSTRRVYTNGLGRVRKSLLSVFLAGLIMAFAPPKPAYTLSIVPTFNPNLSADAVTVINSAIAFYQSTFSDPIKVNIEFHNMSSGLGQSLTFFTIQSYAIVRLWVTMRRAPMTRRRSLTPRAVLTTPSPAALP